MVTIFTSNNNRSQQNSAILDEFFYFIFCFFSFLIHVLTKNMNPMKSLKKQVEKNNRRLKICGNRTSNE